MGQRQGSPLQGRRRVRLARAWAIQASAKFHVGSGTRFWFALSKSSIGLKCISVMYRFADRPSIGCAPAFCLRQNVAKVWAVKNASVPPLKPIIEPGNRLDVKTLPRPSEAMLSHHCDLDMLAVGQSLVGRECMRKMERHILPVASQIDGHFDAIE